MCFYLLFYITCTMHVDSRIILTSLSKALHSASSSFFGHAILSLFTLNFFPVWWPWVARRPSSSLSCLENTEMFPRLWVVSWLGCSCVLPVNFVRYVWFVTLPHQLLALCILSPRMFLPKFPHDYLTFVFPSFNDSCAKFLIVRGLIHVVIIKSACSSHSSFPSRSLCRF